MKHQYFKRRWSVLIGFGTLCLICLMLWPLVSVNYNLSAYLPESSQTRQAMAVIDEEFGLSGAAQVMVEDVSFQEAVALKEQIAKVKGVKSVIFADDMIDAYQPLEQADPALLEQYYKEDAALFQVEFLQDDYSLETEAALDGIRAIVGEGASFSGSSVNAVAMRDATVNELATISLFLMPIFIGILILSSSSWLEPLLYLAVIGVSVLINMGTNLALGDISFITQMTAALLQLAISMDYSLFLLHRFRECRGQGLEPAKAMHMALRESRSSLFASCLTTVAGFVALMFMQYGIGADMGLVLGKGIVISLLCVLFLLPPLALVCVKGLDRTAHRSFLPRFEKLGRGILKARWPILALALLVAIPAFLGQGANRFVYGETSLLVSEGTQIAQEQEKIAQRFGTYNPLVVLVEKGDRGKENQLAQALVAREDVRQVQSLATSVGVGIPDEMLPAGVLEQFEGPHYARMVVMLDLPQESEETYAAVEQIKGTLQSYYPDGYVVLGQPTSITEIKALVESDYTIVNAVAIGIVALIILFTFRSLLLPVLLVFVIQLSIWINMCIPYFQGAAISFIGYMIVSAIQLGATIDYAILLTNRYLDFRRIQDKRAAAVSAVAASAGTILTSAGILCAVGLTEGFVSSIPGVSDLGMLIGRGAALSGILVMALLPQLLVLFDKAIGKTTWHWRRKKQQSLEKGKA